MTKILSSLVLVLIGVSAIASPKVGVMVRPECSVSGAACTIADMAVVQCSNAGTVERLKGLTVCSSPLPGKSRKITRDQVVIALRRGGVADGTYDLLCPSQVSITRNQAVVTGQMLFDTAKAFAEASAQWSGTTVVETTRLPMDQAVPSGTLDLRVKAETKGIRKGQNSLPVEIVVDGNVYRMTQVTVNVKVIASVLVATQAIQRSGAISSANTAIEQRNITRLSDDILAEAPAPDFVASMPISQGSVIRKQWITAPAAVKAGDSVLVIVESKGVRVTDKGTAVQDGRPGDYIKVRLAGDVREIRGTVAEPGIVKIQIGRRTN